MYTKIPGDFVILPTSSERPSFMLETVAHHNTYNGSGRLIPTKHDKQYLHCNMPSPDVTSEGILLMGQQENTLKQNLVS